jgi:hypothetical protein
MLNGMFKVKQSQISFCLLLGIALLLPIVATAKCILPIPDGDGPSPSQENIFGDVEKVDLPYVFIRNGRTKKVEKVSVAKIGEIYSVYGGDAPLSDLRPELQTWIWFRNCTRPSGVTPEVAYFQIFSTDPKDRARLNRKGKIIWVPKSPREQ